VDAQGWGLRVSRYLHLNPVRIEVLGSGKKARQAERQGLSERPGLDLVGQRVERLRNYRWSSYRSYLGVEKAPGWLETRTVLSLGGGVNSAAQRSAYREYVENAIRQDLVERPWEHLAGQLIWEGKS